jgi:hypothetical protein
MKSIDSNKEIKEPYKTYKISLISKGKIVGFLVVNLFIEKRGVSIEYDDKCLRGKLEGRDFFDGLVILREIYNEKGVKLLCKGALKSVFPGGLASETALGELAYQFNSQKAENEIVNIFDEVMIEDSDDIVSFPEQKMYRAEILKKMRRTKGE